MNFEQGKNKDNRNTRSTAASYEVKKEMYKKAHQNLSDNGESNQTESNQTDFNNGSNVNVVTPDSYKLTKKPDISYGEPGYYESQREYDDSNNERVREFAFTQPEDGKKIAILKTQLENMDVKKMGAQEIYEKIKFLESKLPGLEQSSERSHDPEYGDYREQKLYDGIVMLVEDKIDELKSRLVELVKAYTPYAEENVDILRGKIDSEFLSVFGELRLSENKELISRILGKLTGNIHYDRNLIKDMSFQERFKGYGRYDSGMEEFDLIVQLMEKYYK